MMHYVKPCLRKYVEKRILHTGLNDIKSKTTNWIVDNIDGICQSIDLDHSTTQTNISEITQRNDNKELNSKMKHKQYFYL